MSELVFNRAPIGVSLQDAGRLGYARYGVSSAGAMDWARHSMVNGMLEKPLLSTILEIGPAGVGISLSRGDLQIAFAGPRFSIVLEGETLMNPCRFIMREGQSLDIIPKSGAMWGYLGIQGSFDVPKVLGSQSENSISGMLPFKVEAGGSLTVRQDKPIIPLRQAYIDPYIAKEKMPIGIIPSSQYADFSDEMKNNLVNTSLAIEPRFDRMAYRLEGIRIACVKGHDILSDGVTMGAIQVPGDGKPYILMADHQSTGGYPKIACVCKADLPRIAQMAPGKLFEMRWRSIKQAISDWIDINQQIASLTALSIQPKIDKK